MVHMELNAVTIVGLFAGGLTTLSFLPQLLKTWKTKSAEDVSLLMLVAFSTGVALWLIYGFMIGALPVVLANVITLVLALAILVLKIKYR
jgi:MtN3 and saliva related transmembrane protein